MWHNEGVEKNFNNDESRRKFMDIKENLAFEEESYILFPILSIEDAIEHRVVTTMFSNIDLKRKTTTEMQMRKLILKLEDNFSLDGESDAVNYNTLYA